MKTTHAFKPISAFALLVAAGAAAAHDGHGMARFHWHATDTLGFVIVAVLAAAAIWFSRGGK